MSLETANFETANFTVVPPGYRGDSLVSAGPMNPGGGIMPGQLQWAAGENKRPSYPSGEAGTKHRAFKLPAAALLAAIQAVDIVLLIGSGLLASRWCEGWYGPVAAGQSILLTLAAAGSAALVLNQLRVYAPDRLSSTRFRLRAGLFAILAGGTTGALCSAMLPGSMAHFYAWPLLWLVTAGCAVLAVAVMTAEFARSSVNRDRLARRIAVVGNTAYSRTFIERVRSSGGPAVTFVGLYEDDGPGLVGMGVGVPVLGGIDDLVLRSRRERIDAIVLALPLADRERIARSQTALRSVTTDVYVAAEVLELACKSGQVDRLGPNAVVKIASRPLNEWQTVQKTAFDLILSAILLVAILPIMAIVALLIRMDSPGPVLFRQPRLGFNNTMFSVYKFRTMYHHMTDMHADRQTTRDDKRITRIGRLLRKTSLDEIPQLFNVLRGDMSLVGPRPHATNTKAGEHLFHDVVADYALRHRVKPGITGWAQVNGWRGETRTRYEIEQRVAHDLHYIDSWSLLLDIKIVVLTIVRELNSKVAF